MKNIKRLMLFMSVCYVPHTIRYYKASYVILVFYKEVNQYFIEE